MILRLTRQHKTHLHWAQPRKSLMFQTPLLRDLLAFTQEAHILTCAMLVISSVLNTCHRNHQRRQPACLQLLVESVGRSLSHNTILNYIHFVSLVLSFCLFSDQVLILYMCFVFSSKLHNALFSHIFSFSNFLETVLLNTSTGKSFIQSIVLIYLNNYSSSIYSNNK